MNRLIMAMAMAALTVLGADVSGKWKGTAETPNGTIERTFDFKVDGEKLTGTTRSEMMGESQITNGKVAGDTLTFSIVVKFQDNEMKLDYTGKVVGNEIKFKVDGANGLTLEYNAKKIS